MVRIPGLGYGLLGSGGSGNRHIGTAEVQGDRAARRLPAEHRSGRRLVWDVALAIRADRSAQRLFDDFPAASGRVADR
ncbi:hypothetical protein D1872_248500 [compost metagenome]